MAGKKPTGDGKSKGGGAGGGKPAPKACPVWLAGRCDGNCTGCTAAGGR